MNKVHLRAECEYEHDVCKWIDSQGGTRGGAGVMIIVHMNHKIYTLMGYEKKRHGYTLSMGKRGNETCYMETAQRELYEEFKFELTGQIINNEHFLENGKVRCILVNTTPIFVGFFDQNEIRLEELNEKIEKDNNNETLKNDMKEMRDVKLFDINDIQTEIKVNLKEENYNYYSCMGNRIVSFTMDVITSFLLR